MDLNSLEIAQLENVPSCDFHSVVVLPPAFESLREELECQLLKAGIVVMPPSVLEEIHGKGSRVIGPGLIDPLHIPEVNFKTAQLLENPYLPGPTEIKRGGNNKPWIDVALQKRRAKIAKHSKRKNRK